MDESRDDAADQPAEQSAPAEQPNLAEQPAPGASYPPSHYPTYPTYPGYSGYPAAADYPQYPGYSGYQPAGYQPAGYQPAGYQQGHYGAPAQQPYYQSYGQPHSQQPGYPWTAPLPSASAAMYPGPAAPAGIAPRKGHRRLYITSGIAALVAAACIAGVVVDQLVALVAWFGGIVELRPAQFERQRLLDRQRLLGLRVGLGFRQWSGQRSGSGQRRQLERLGRLDEHRHRDRQSAGRRRRHQHQSQIRERASRRHRTGPDLQRRDPHQQPRRRRRHRHLGHGGVDRQDVHRDGRRDVRHPGRRGAEAHQRQRPANGQDLDVGHGRGGRRGHCGRQRRRDRRHAEFGERNGDRAQPVDNRKR